MSDRLPIVYIARHGETAWSLTGQHTGLTDLPLTEHGQRNARNLGKRLAGIKFTRVYCSPLQRARHTCELAGFLNQAIIDPDLVEWDHGDYDGTTTAEILAQRPDWELFPMAALAGRVRSKSFFSRFGVHRDRLSSTTRR